MNAKRPPVTIGISFYNAEATLLDSIRSVFAQTHENWELILIDDGSSDRSLEIAQSINDPRVRVYSDGRNKKLAARLNEITDLARYDYIARMDADDLMARNRIEKQLDYLLRNPDLDLVSTGVLSLSDDNEPLGSRCVDKNHKITGKKLLFGRGGIVHASILAKKSWYQRNRYKEDLPSGQDVNLWLRAYSKSDFEISFICEPLYFYREDGSVTTEKLLRGYRLGRISIMQDAKDRFCIFHKLLAVSRSYLKTAFVRLFSSYGALHFLRRRRNRSAIANKDWAKKFNLEIEAILKVELPM